MNPITQLVPVVADRTAKGYRLRVALAYIGIFIISAGDTVRYGIGWVPWGTLSVGLSLVSLIVFLRSKPSVALKRVPYSLVALLALMLLSTAWSFYPKYTLVGLAGTLIATFFALFLVASFTWRDLLGLFANTFRFIVGASILFEIYAAFVVHGPIAPIFKNYKGDVPPSGAYYWTQGTLLKGSRIQGILGNANLLAYISMLAVILFLVQFAVRSTARWITVISLLVAFACLGLTRSAGIGISMFVAGIVLVIALITEGHDRETRHRYYRVAWTGFGILFFFGVVYRDQLFTWIGKSPDMTGRSDIWKAVLGLIGQRPIQGWGWISYWMPGVKPYEGLIVRDNVTYYQAHNSYLDVWLQLGILGFALFVAMLVFLFIKLWRMAARHTSPLYLWPLLVFVALLVQNLTESRMIVELGWVLVVMFAVKVNEPAEKLEEQGTTKKLTRFTLALKRK